MIRLKSLISENTLEWRNYTQLSREQQAALYEYMVTSGDVDPSEYNSYIQTFVFKTMMVSPDKLKRVFDKDGWDWLKGLSSNDEARIQKIDREINQTKQKWPYIVNAATSFSQWAENEYHHGDGFHRMLLAVRKNEPIEFLFPKRK
jgi:hypothetical protein